MSKKVTYASKMYVKRQVTCYHTPLGTLFVVAVHLKSFLYDLFRNKYEENEVDTVGVNGVTIPICSHWHQSLQGLQKHCVPTQWFMNWVPIGYIR